MENISKKEFEKISKLSNYEWFMESINNEKQTIMWKAHQIMNKFQNVIYVDEELSKKYKLSMLFLSLQLMDFLLTQFIILFNIWYEVNPVIISYWFLFWVLLKIISSCIVAYYYIKKWWNVWNKTFYIYLFILILININHFRIILWKITVNF